MTGYPLSLRLHSACSFHPSGRGYRDSQQSLPVVTQSNQLAWGVLSRHFLMECAQAVTLDAPELCHLDSIYIFSVELFTDCDYKTGCFSNVKGKKAKDSSWAFARERERKKMVAPECAC